MVKAKALPSSGSEVASPPLHRRPGIQLGVVLGVVLGEEHTEALAVMEEVQGGQVLL